MLPRRFAKKCPDEQRDNSKKTLSACLEKGQRRKKRTQRTILESPALAVGTQLKPDEMAGGLPPRCFVASNFQPRLGGLQFTQRVSVPFQKCGFKRVQFHAPSRASLLHDNNN